MVKPQIWFHTMPFVTKAYFVASLLTLLALRVYPALWSSLDLNWTALSSGLQVWRLLSNFLVWAPGLLMSSYQIGLLSVYFRALELEFNRTHREAFNFALLLLWGIALTIGTSYAVWPELRFGGPVLLMYCITLYAMRAPDADASFFGLTLARKWLPLAHWIILWVLQTNWTLAALGIAFGVGTGFALRLLDERTGLRLPESLYRFGEKLQLGQAAKSWQVNRATGSRLGGD